jgi:hypothetical protein
MDAAMAAPEEPNLQPQPMSNWSSFFFFVAFVLVVGYTLLNLYIGVVFYQFSRIRMQSQTGSAFLTDDQTEWVEMSKLVFRLKPPEKRPVPVNKIRRWVCQERCWRGGGGMEDQALKAAFEQVRHKLGT